MSEANRRLHFRVPLHQAATWSESNKNYNTCLVEDLSTTGARLKLEAPLDPSQQMGLLYWTPVPGTPPLLLHCKVIREEGSLVGVEFVELSKRTQVILEHFVDMHQRARSASSGDTEKR